MDDEAAEAIRLKTAVDLLTIAGESLLVIVKTLDARQRTMGDQIEKLERAVRRMGDPQ